jgi:excinuclease ABC subunit B
VNGERFLLKADFEPAGDQPKAISKLVKGYLEEGCARQTLMGVTGSGKTFTVANVIAALGMPTLVMTHNKTLCAQLYEEFRALFPENAVGYFVSYYDYYQPEAYVPQKDLYIEKDADINEEIDRLRHHATKSLLLRRDVIIVATVSAIYGLGSPEEYLRRLLRVEVGQSATPLSLSRELARRQYTRNDLAAVPGTYRLTGDVIEVVPSDARTVFRIEIFGGTVEAITELDLVGREPIAEHRAVLIFPNTHYLAPEDRYAQILENIEREMRERVKWFLSQNRLLEAQRLEQRVRYDLDMLRETGYVKGIENYSRHISGRAPGEPPACLLDYFPRPFFTVVDESHVTLPQIRGMYEGDRSRKETLVEYGFRLPSALDNRPLKYEEWDARLDRVLYMSATPGEEERRRSCKIVEQIIRPTFLVDPEVEVRPARGQINDLLKELEALVKNRQRALVISLTKRTAEDISYFLKERNFRAEYLHSEVDAIGRVKVLRALRQGTIDIVVGINLLREGLDLPEVALVAILDADREGFLRSETSLIQIMGRAARNVSGRVILYADEITGSMKRALDEAARRRNIQAEYNRVHHLRPKSVQKEIRRTSIVTAEEDEILRDAPPSRVIAHIKRLEEEMFRAAERLEFEYAATLRDKINILAERLESYDTSASPSHESSS